MPTYMVESYWPGITSPRLIQATSHAMQVAEQMWREGIAVRYLQSTLLPLEESVFLLFEGTSADVVATVSTRAEIPFERITEVCHLTAPRSGRPNGSKPGERAADGDEEASQSG